MIVCQTQCRGFLCECVINVTNKREISCVVHRRHTSIKKVPRQEQDNYKELQKTGHPEKYIRKTNAKKTQQTVLGADELQKGVKRVNNIKMSNTNRQDGVRRQTCFGSSFSQGAFKCDNFNPRE